MTGDWGRRRPQGQGEGRDMRESREEETCQGLGEGSRGLLKPGARAADGEEELNDEV